MFYAILIIIILTIFIYFKMSTLIIAGFVLGIILAYFRAKRKNSIFELYDRKTPSDNYNKNYSTEEVAELKKIFDVKYLPSDFKKKNGYKRSVEMCAEYDVYRQCYCGCVFAALDQGIDLNEYKY